MKNISTGKILSDLRIPLSRIHLQNRVWPVISLGLLLLQLLWPHRAWLTLLIILGIVWVISFLWTYLLAGHLQVERALKYGWAQVGDQLEERFTVENTCFIPALWLEVEDHSTLPDYNAGRVTSLSGNDTYQWKNKRECTRRGLFTLGPTTLRAGDPFGLCKCEIHKPDSAVLLVLPPILPLPSIEIAAGGRVGEGRRPRPAALETTVSVETVREYVPGDPLKSIHWSTSAKRDTLYVRQFDHMPASDWWIFLDLDKRAQCGEGSASTAEHGIILAASLADRGIRQGNSVGLVVCGQELTWLDPQRSSGHLVNLLRALAVIQPGVHSLSELLGNARQAIRRGASLILITPNVGGEWAAPMMDLLKKGIVPTVLLMDPISFGKNESASGIVNLLTNYGITHNLIQKELLDRPEARPGMQGKWEWRVVGPGKVVVKRRPLDLGWKKLGS
jgi:uncharacterized protein (DUF58 family)